MGNLISKEVSTPHPYDHLIQLISPKVMSVGYQIVHLEVHTHRQRILRIFIDHLESSKDRSVGIDDCVEVSRALDEYLDQIPEIESLFQGTYELEVSSPGIDRPLRTSGDFERFSGRQIRVHVFRPLTIDEIENKAYQEKNPKQKNFFGTLIGLKEGKVSISIASSGKSSKKSKKQKKTDSADLHKNQTQEEIRILIPLPLISKANLEPEFDFEGPEH